MFGEKFQLRIDEFLISFEAVTYETSIQILICPEKALKKIKPQRFLFILQILANR